ncbi:hypothetical protein BJX76DRAFT_353958 [Aspergillus varians]
MGSTIAATEVDVLIVGAGVVGLTLAHALQKRGISCQIFERDESIDSGGNGWGITIHWAQHALEKCIPEKKDPGSYKFFNLETLERKFTDVIDPLTFQGCHPVLGVYMFWCLVSTPELNGSAGSPKPYYQAQVRDSWNPRKGEGDIPATSAGKVARIKELCADMAAPIKKMVNSIPDSSEAIGVKLQDWPCLDWDNRGGRVTLAGDLAHAMTMYRGEAANFGIVDAADPAEAIAAFTKDGVPQAQAIEDYELKLRTRSAKGVLNSRQACIDAHDLTTLTPESPLLCNR